MDLEVMVTLVKRHNFKNDQGEEVKGLKIYYEGDEQVNTKDMKGIEFFILSAPYEAFDHFSVVPGKYSIHCNMKIGPKGAPKLVYQSANLLDKKVG